MEKHWRFPSLKENMLILFYEHLHGISIHMTDLFHFLITDSLPHWDKSTAIATLLKSLIYLTPSVGFGILRNLYSSYSIYW